MIEYLEKGPTPLHPMQFGFRSKHSTDSANCLFIEKTKKALDKNKFVGAAFLDLSKAFDTVNHNILLNKLTHFNFSADTIECSDPS